MNKNIKTTIKAMMAACALTPMLTGCLEEVYPTDSMTQEQVEGESNSLEILTNGICRRMMELGSDYSSIGYAGVMLSLDVAAGDLPVRVTTYDYPRWFAQDTYLSESGLTAYDWWQMYTGLIHDANLVLEKAPQSSEATLGELSCMGAALAYRALAYMDMVRLYEYKHTGVGYLDAEAEARGIYKLTVPLVTETTTEEQARHNPRQPFYVMYRFIMNDLNRAETYLQGTDQSAYNMPDAAVVYGLKARLWLELGSRFTLYPEDLQTQMDHEADESLNGYDRLGIKTADDCFGKAAAYARMAINEGGTPLTETEWHERATGFNSANHAWLWAVEIGKDDISSSEWAYFSYVGMLSPEAEFGVANNTYKASRMIDAALYSTIADGDWRKRTWIDPADAGTTQNASKYSTLLSNSEWAQHVAYTGFKFRPGDGDMNNYMNGVAVDIPLMRVEEMYLIEAEALAHSQGVGAGAAALESFVNSYRWTGSTAYTCGATTVGELTDEILRQKRIEFWGEGIVGYDFKRLEKAVKKTYDGSNHPSEYQTDTYDGYVAARFNVCFPLSNETTYNDAIVNNPNPTSAYSQTDEE